MFNFSKKFKFHFRDLHKGLTLIELLVVLAIFSVVSSMVMFDYGGFRSTTSTQNLVNDIALSIRKAQSSAIGVVKVDSTFQYGHGIHFSVNKLSNSMIGSNKSFILFTDIGNSGYYKNNNNSSNCNSPMSNNECEEMLNIKGPDKISSFSIYQNGVRNVKHNGFLDIVFTRPNPDASFCYRSTMNSPCTQTSTLASSITITITNDQDSKQPITKKITVWNTGQISVQ